MAQNFEITREYIQHLQELIESKDSKSLLKEFKDLHPADIAEVFDILSMDEVLFIFPLVDNEIAQ
jgi:magnesium transporter